MKTYEEALKEYTDTYGTPTFDAFRDLYRKYRKTYRLYKCRTFIECVEWFG